MFQYTAYKLPFYEWVVIQRSFVIINMFFVLWESMLVCKYEAFWKDRVQSLIIRWRLDPWAYFFFKIGLRYLMLFKPLYFLILYRQICLLHEFSLMRECYLYVWTRFLFIFLVFLFSTSHLKVLIDHLTLFVILHRCQYTRTFQSSFLGWSWSCLFPRETNFIFY